MKAFDRKFGPEFLAALPPGPAVYRVYCGAGELIYVGKAKNLRRRISQYRNAKRRKKHHKMRAIVQEACRIEYDSFTTEREACLVEARLIQERRPRWNVAGAFYFLYPLVGLKFEDGLFHLCYTSRPELFKDQGFEFHGAYRSRGLTGDAFFALVRLLGFVGHPIRARRGSAPRGTYSFAFRRIPEDWKAAWSQFCLGESNAALELLVLALLENAGARKHPRRIQERINELRRFWKHEVLILRRARERARYAAYPVPQRERDMIFIESRFSSSAGATP
jgi:hypothetical protein